jgi:pyrophosphatase PpaX
MDLDQTLIDSRESIMRSFEHALRQVLDREVSRESLAQLWGRPLRTQMAELAGERYADKLVEAYRQHLWTLDHLVTMYEGLQDILPELRARGYRLGIVTSKGRSASDRHMGLHGLRRMVDVTVTADDTVHHKPDPEPFMIAARQLQVAPSRCLAVGDSPWDILAANRAGMTSALALWGMFDPAAFRREGAAPHIELPTPARLLAICPPLAEPREG